MSEKTKKILMKELYRGMAALVLFVIAFALCFFVPEIKERLIKVLAKDTDLKKVASLLLQIVKEIAP